MRKKIRVLIADDHPLLRHGLRDIISHQSDLKVVGEASNGAQVLELLDVVKPDVLILDIDMPIMDGIETARVLRKRPAPPKVIFLTIHKSRSIVRSMRELGVSGYVVKDAVMDEIVESIRSVNAGASFVGEIPQGLTAPQVGAEDGTPVVEMLKLLTETESKILEEIARARTNREIADSMFLSIRTVETHRYNICSKLGLKGIHALLKFAVQNRSLIEKSTL